MEKNSAHRNNFFMINGTSIYIYMFHCIFSMATFHLVTSSEDMERHINIYNTNSYMQDVFSSIGPGRLPLCQLVAGALGTTQAPFSKNPPGRPVSNVSGREV